MEEFVPIHLIGSDENSNHFNFLQSEKEKRLDGVHNGPIKLRNLNARNDRPAFRGSIELVAYLKKPEPAVGPSVKLRDDSPDLGGELGAVRSIYIPESPSLSHTLAYNNTEICSPVTKLMRMDDGSALDLAPVSKLYDDGFDCQPFYHVYDYENRLEADDYELLLHQMMEDDLNGQKPVFDREMEYQELKKIVRATDYILYYVFDVDKLNFFQLKEERDKFREYTYESYTRPLRYKDSPESGEIDDEDFLCSYEDHETDPAICDISSVMSLDKYV